MQILFQCIENRQRGFGSICHLRFAGDHPTDIWIQRRETTEQMDRLSEFLGDLLRSPVPSLSRGL
jgi:hypothetical protein